MKGIVVATVLGCLFEVAFGRVAVDASNIKVDCGKETRNTTDASRFGPFTITITLKEDLWDASNYTVYAFEDEDGCAFTASTPIDSPLEINNISNRYVGVYTWNYAEVILPVGDSEKCGLRRTTESRIEVDIAVVEGTLFTTNDKVFRIYCEYNPDTLDDKYAVGEGGIIPTPPETGGTATPNKLDLTYNLELVSADTGRVIEGTVPIGTPVQLRVRAEGDDDGSKGGVPNDENGLKVLECKAKNTGLGDKLVQVTLITDYCTEFKDGIDFVEKPDPADRKGFTSVDLLSFSPAFEMFALTGGKVDHVVIFTCVVEVCRIDGVCDGDNCPSKRKRRDASPKLNAMSVFRSRRAADLAGTSMVTMSIVVDESAASGNSVVGAVGATTEMTTLVVALAVVGVLLLLCVVVAIAVAMRLTQRRKTTEKTTVVHHDNPAYDQH